MSEFFLELFSEEIPPKLQISARENLLKILIDFLNQEKIKYDKNFSAISTPNRLIIFFKKIETLIIRQPIELKGPNTNSSEEAIKGFIKSNKISKSKLIKKKTPNGEFYFYKKPLEKVKTKKLLEDNIPKFLSKIKWQKSMRWGNYDLIWGRPLKSIMALYDGQKLNFNYFHLKNINRTYIDKNHEQTLKVFKNFDSYIKYFKTKGIILDHNQRKKFIDNALNKISASKRLNLIIKDKLLDEVVNIVDKPNVALCSFDEKFLKMPQELIILTIEYHQKYFLTYDKNNKLTNNFFIVSDCKDPMGIIKEGNENVVRARLSDAEYFWKKNKSQNMIKQVFLLKNVNYFRGLGNYFDKAQRLKKLAGLISDEFLISKDKIEIASSICKVDLLSDLVSEFPELQGIIGGYFAEMQGFDKDVCLAIKEQYLPTGNNSKIPKNIYSVTLSLSDKIDTLVGFFGLNLFPSSSKDPYALRRLAIGLIKILIENKKNIKLNEIINFSKQIFKEQSIELNSKIINSKLHDFILERFKNYMKDKGIRYDIVESSVNNFNLDKLLVIYTKAEKLNKIINKQTGLDLVGNYKRAFNILNSNTVKFDNISMNVDPALFINDYEKELYKKIHDIRKNFTSIKIENDFDAQLLLLASIKIEITNFFDNVVVNDSDENIKNNRLLLLNMVCKTFDSYLNFAKIETI